MNLTAILTIALSSLLSSQTHAYDIGCIYPEEMPTPIKARELLIEFLSTNATREKFETPRVVRGAAGTATCGANCLAVHDTNALNVLTLQRPSVFVPFEQHHNSFSRMLCIAQCLALLIDTAGPDKLAPFWEEWGLDGSHEATGSIQGLRQDVVAAVIAAANGNTASLKQMLSDEEFHPFLMGQIVFIEIASAFRKDGFNSLGAWKYDTESGDAVPCTANCAPYSDTTGYYPKNYPSAKAAKAAKSKQGTSKYIVEGADKYWQPLYEDDGNGYFSHQMHVMPHIGFTVEPILFASVSDLGTTPEPDYDYRSEALQVIEQLKVTASDPIKKQKIAFYDDKLLVRGLIQNEMRRQFSTTYSFEEELLFIYNIGVAEYDATLQAWREKVRHDLVRPTTVIKRWGSDVLNTFSGDKSMDGPKEINARDFQAFQRVMPHSEYPSASACLCTSYTEFTDAFSREYHGDILTNLKWGGDDGFKVGCDPEQVPLPLVSRGCNDEFVVPNMATLGAECGKSRLWAGLHFTKAVSAAEEVCAGIGDMALDHEKTIRNGSTFGTIYYLGDDRPTCSAEPPKKLWQGV